MSSRGMIIGVRFAILQFAEIDLNTICKYSECLFGLSVSLDILVEIRKRG